MEWEKIFAQDTTDKGFMFKICKRSRTQSQKKKKKPDTQKTTTQSENEQKILNRLFFQRRHIGG